MKRLVLVVAVAPALLATSCPPRVRIDPAPSPVRAPAFTFHAGGRPSAPITEFAVTQCRPGELRRPVWRVARSRRLDATAAVSTEPPARDSAEALRIAYGETPEGFTELVAPEALAPGRCYLAEATTGFGGGTREFRILPDGRMELGRANVFHARGARELNRAAIHCRRGYKGASRADSLRVDARAHAVADTSVTCGELRTTHAEVMKAAMSRETRVLVVSIGAVALGWLIGDGIDGSE